MIAGLPGTGLAGLFFILSALAMPFVQVARAARGGACGAWRSVVTHAAVATGMVFAIDAAARLLRWLVGSPASVAVSGRADQGVAGVGDGVLTFQMFGLPAVVVAVGSLGALLTLSALVGRLSRRATPVIEPPPAELVAVSQA